MARSIPRIGTVLQPYDPSRRYSATVTGYAKIHGSKMIRLRSNGTRRITTASLKHLTSTFRVW
jgi:hypothetical protein